MSAIKEHNQLRTGRRPCTGCGTPDTLSITLTASKDRPRLTMTSCPRCEHREWTGSDGRLAQGDVLQLLAGRSDFIFRPTFRGDRRRN